MGRLIAKGFKVVFEENLCNVFDVMGQEILKVRMQGKSFFFNPKKEEPVVYFSKASNIETWHKRLCHCHVKRMQLMKKNNVIEGLPTLEDALPNCHACQYGKQKRKSFPKSTWRTKQKLQLIHTCMRSSKKSKTTYSFG